MIQKKTFIWEGAKVWGILVWVCDSVKLYVLTTVMIIKCQIVLKIFRSLIFD